MASNWPERPKDPDQQPPESQDEAELRSIQNLAIIASIAGPISLIIGGIFLNTIALILAGIAFWRITQVLKDDSKATVVVKEIKKTCVIAIIGCSIAFVLNIVSMVSMYPTFIETLNENISSGAFSEDSIPKGIETWG